VVDGGGLGGGAAGLLGGVTGSSHDNSPLLGVSIYFSEYLVSTGVNAV
jgi:hypothetical protein